MDLSAVLASTSRRAPDIRGKGTIGWKLMHWLDDRGRLHGEWRLALPDGSRFVLPRKAPMAWSMAFCGSYDAASRAVLLEYVEPQTLVLDIGAAVGLWTVPLGLHAQSIDARVWAFEPHPNNHHWLHDNVLANGLQDVVTIREVALGDVAGIVTMDAGEAGLPGAGGNAAIAVSGDRGIVVPVVTLDSIALPARVSAIKIDVEGYEIRVLRGAMGMIQADRPAIFGEFHPGWFRARGEDCGSFLDDMRDLGYEVFTAEGTRTRSWRAIDTARIRRLSVGEACADLLLIPGARYFPRAKSPL